MGIVGGAVDCSDKGIGKKNCDDLKFFRFDSGKEVEFVVESKPVARRLHEAVGAERGSRRRLAESLGPGGRSGAGPERVVGAGALGGESVQVAAGAAQRQA